MKKRLLVIVVVVSVILMSGILISGCTPAPEVIEEKSEVIEEKEELVGEELVGPGGCTGEACGKYCEENAEECRAWCAENRERCKKILSSEAQRQFAGDFPGGFGISPEACQQNPEECLAFCEENPEACPEEIQQRLGSLGSGMPFGDGRGLFPGGASAFPPLGLPGGKGERIEEVAEPPDTDITFAKSLNLIVGQFTEDDVIKAKELGANMVTFWPMRMVRSDEFSVFDLGDLPQMINLAHENGLHVELRSSIIIPEVASNYEKYKQNAISHAADYAQLAEKYKVSRIIPFAEIDNDMMNHCGRTGELARELLKEMRKHYTGKIGVGVAAPWRDCGFAFEGYDYLSISAYPHNDLATSINWAREVADRSGIPIVHLGETGIYNPGDERPPDDFKTLEVSKEGEADYYRDLFVQFSDTINGVSIFFGGVSRTSGGVAMSINGDPAEEVVKEWYHKLGPGIESKEDATKLIVANPLDLSQIARISKFRSCAGHDYSGLNIVGERETLRSMKHYLEFFPKFLGSENTVKVFSPFDGKVTEIIEAGGKQVFISADTDPAWHFIFFHINPEPDIKEGAVVEAGQLVGYAYVSAWPTFDFALKEFSRTGEIFESPFSHLQNAILEEYASYGVTTENIIVTKQYRDTHPCPVQGTRDGEEAFTGETEKEDFVSLK